MQLNKYQEKRKFNSTPEPKGKVRKSFKFSFVVQRHYASHLHYDFRLEIDGVLKSWAIPKGPSLKVTDKRLAVMTEDHPIEYGSFYGNIPEGNYGAGEVEIWDEGSFIPYDTNLPKSKWNAHFSQQLENGDLKIVIKGTNINGAFALVRMNGKDSKNWLLIKKADEFSKKTFKIENIASIHVKNQDNVQKTNDIQKSDKTNENILEDDFFKLSKPMLATASKSTKVRPDWIYETKYDGYRAISKINGGNVSLFSRNQNNFSADYPEITKDLSRIDENVILDGEIVILNKNGISDFQKLQNLKSQLSNDKLKKVDNLCYFVFDILFLNGHKITDLPLYERKELLENLIKNYKFNCVYFSPYILREGQKFFEDQVSKGEEGIIAKDSQGRYVNGSRSDNWLKFKKKNTVDALICGYTEPQNSRKYFGSLLLGLPEGKEIKYIGNVGSGFASKDLKDLYNQFVDLEIKNSSFPDDIKLSYSKGKVHWVKPKLVAEISYGSITKDKHLRHPVFNRLRNDKKSPDKFNSLLQNGNSTVEVYGKANNTEVKEGQASNNSSIKFTQENDELSKSKGPTNKIDKKINKKIAQKEVAINLTPQIKNLISNPQKILFPELGIKKEDLVQYYQSVSQYILPFLKNRPLSLYRLPNGIHKNGFFQKDKGNLNLPDFVETTSVFSESNNAKIDYMLCNNKQTLAYINNLASIELHAWLSALPTLENPDFLLLDLDPDGNNFDELIEIAHFIHQLCEDIKIPNFVKTSGKSGIHIYIPLEKNTSFEQSKLTGEIIMHIVHRNFPKNTSIERATAARKGKIYLDFLQNRKAQTVVVPYSVRPVEAASVSMPILWETLKKGIRPGDFTVNNVPEILKKNGNSWIDYGKKRLNISKTIQDLQDRFTKD